MKSLNIQHAMLRSLLPLRFCMSLGLGLLAAYPLAAPAALPLTGSERQVLQQVENLVLPKVSFTDATLAEILRYIVSESRRLDRGGVGVRIRCNPASLPSSVTNVVTLDLKNVPLKELLVYLTRLLDIEWSIVGGEIVLTKTATESNTQALFESAEAGDPEAQFDLGFRLWEEKNYAESAKWLRKAADQGNPSAQTLLGMLYADGNGVAQSDFEAAKWYSKAAKGGDAYAQFFLAEAYSEGRGVSKDQEEAARLMKEAAAKDNSHAQATLGWWYVNGINVEEDLDQGMKLLRAAADQGNEDAGAYLAKLEAASNMVNLSKPVEFPAMINGKTVGMTTAPPGTAVRVLKREADKVCVQYQESGPVWIEQSAVSTGTTDGKAQE
jgi:hypothetical protein